MRLEAYDAARAAIAQTGFTPAVQSKISLFLMAAKNTNALFLGAVELQPFAGVAHQFLHAQYFLELEAVLLLSKVTRWTTDPAVYAQAINITAPIWNDWRLMPGFHGASAGDRRSYYRGLALGHALLSQVRMTPVIPANADETDPYVVALRSIEQDSARMIQTQINLLRTTSADIPEEEAEALIEEKQLIVKAAFLQFLEWLCQSEKK
jgi:hypothetical protein